MKQRLQVWVDIDILFQVSVGISHLPPEAFSQRRKRFERLGEALERHGGPNERHGRPRETNRSGRPVGPIAPPF